VSFTIEELAQSQLVAILGTLPRYTEFDLWSMIGITPTISTKINIISDLHITALLFELKCIKMDVNTSTNFIANRDNIQNITICLDEHDMDFEEKVNMV